MSNILVVGAGICGSSLIRAAKSAGFGVALIDDARPMDSLAAAAVLRRAWHKGDERALFDRTLQLYAQWGVPLLSGAIVTSYRRTPPKHDADWHMVAPADPLWQASITGHATAIDEHTVAIDARPTARGPESDHEVVANHVLWATGRYQGEVGGVTYGVTWVHDDPLAALVNPQIMRVHHIAPYKSVMAGTVGRRARFGSSSATSSEKAWDQARSMLDLGEAEGIIKDKANWEPKIGVRVKSAKAATLGGMHRTGYALAPALAERIIARIGR